MIFVFMDTNYPPRLHKNAWKWILGRGKPVVIIKQARNYLGEVPIVDRIFYLSKSQNLDAVFYYALKQKGTFFFLEHTDYENECISYLRQRCKDKGLAYYDFSQSFSFVF